MQPRFRIVRAVARGGQGRVMAVEDAARGGRLLALKEPHRGQVSALRREFGFLSRLRHPHLAAVFDWFEESPLGTGGVPAYTQAWVEGAPLWAGLAEASEEARIEAFTQVMQALAYLHALDIVHLDLKPANVLVTSGERPQACVLDFGIAAQAGGSEEIVRGTLGYLAPERLDGKPVDGRADLYALGAMMAEVWIGRAPSHRLDPADGRSTDARERALIEDGLPPSWASLVACLLASAPEDRPETVAHAARLWGRALGRSVPLHTPGTIQAILRAGPPVGRSALVSTGLKIVSTGGALVLHGTVGSGRRTVARAMGSQLQAEGHSVERWPGAPEQGTIAGFREAVSRLLGRELPPGWLAPAAPSEDPAVFQRTLERQASEAIDDLGHGPEAAPRPVLVVEASGAAPPAVKAVLDGLVRRSEGGGRAPLGLVLVAERWDGPGGMELPPLGRDAVDAFVAARLGAGEVADRLGAALTAASGGLALHLETLVGLLVAREELRFGLEGWTWHGDAASIALPEEMDEAAAQRVGLLTPVLREALGALQWLRFPSSPAVLAVALEGDRSDEEVTGLLRELAAAGLVDIDARDRWYIAHGVVGAAAAGWTPPSGSAGAHGRLVAREDMDALARAWHTGGSPGAAQAADLADAAWREGRLAEAARALDLALELDPDHVEALMRRAEVANLLGPRERQVACLERLLVLAEAGTETRLQAGARLLWARTRTGDLGAAEALAEEVLHLAQSLDAPRTEAEVLVHLAIARTQGAAYDAAEALLERAAGLARELADLGLQARIANNLGNILAYRDAPEAALARYREAYDLKEAEGDPVGCRIALGNVGLMSLRLGQWAEALTSFSASHRRARETGHRRGEAWSLVGLAIVGLEGGAYGYAERRASEAQEIAEELGDGLVGCDALTTLAEVALARGDRALAEARARSAWTTATELQSGYSRAWSGAVLASACLDEDAASALKLALEAHQEPGADGRARIRALGAAADAAVRSGDLSEAGRAVRAGVDLDPRSRTPVFVALAMRVWRLTGDTRAESELRGWAREAVSRWTEAWPEEAWDDGLDAQECFDGPSRHTFGRLLRELGLVEETRTGGDDVGEDQADVMGRGDVAWVAAACAGTPREWRGALGALLGRLVGRLTAERAFLVDGGGQVVAARDADGEAVSDAGRKVPGAAIDEARAAGGVWRATGEKGGALLACPVPVPDGVEAPVVVLQNRFLATAFDGLEGPPSEVAALGTLLRLERLHSQREAAQAALAAEHEKEHTERTRTTQEILRLRQELEVTREQLGPRHAYTEIVFTSSAMKRMLRRLDRVIDTDLPVYVHGESGTGKELVAKAVHGQGSRAAGPFVAQNCSAIPSHLFESEFFGHAKGAFTGADRASEGLFRRADGGTLFLDEIGDLPLELQAKLLRVIETREVRPVGGARAFQVDVRIVCATHRDLSDLVEKGTFREDLYYRLNVVRIDIPPLRERPDDVPPLVAHFLALRAPDREVTLDEGVMRAFLAYDWPGNVRQLENEISRALVLSEDRIEVRHLSPEVASGGRGAGGAPGAGADLLRMLGVDRGTLRDRVDRLEYLLLKSALDEASGNKSEVSRVMGLSRAGLNMKLKRLGLWEQAAG